MQQLRILNKKEIKELLDILERQWSFSGHLEYVFLMNNRNRIYLSNKEVFDFDFSSLRVDSIGMYFGERILDEIRVSIEGSQLVGPHCSRGIFDLTDHEFQQWIRGKDIERIPEGHGFFLVRHTTDFIGSGKVGKEKFYNFLSKSRRISAAE